MLGFVLRVLMCVSLILGGASSAVAGVRSHLMHAQAVQAGAALETDAVDTDAPCHEAASDKQPQSPGSSERVHAPDVEAAPHGPDCCKPGHCKDACVQVAQAVLWSHGFEGGVAADVAKAFERESVHAAPDPQHLIRPPIG